MAASLTDRTQLPIDPDICFSQKIIFKKIERCSIVRYNCPCCSYTLLRHIGSQGIYWFCRHCRQEMPVFDNPSNYQLFG